MNDSQTPIIGMRIGDLVESIDDALPVDFCNQLIGGFDHEIVETINLTDKRVTIRIELARDGNYWMFSTSLNHPNGGCGYRVGRKWGERANNRGDALCFAFEELLNRADIYPNVKKQVSQLLAKLPESYLLEILV